MPNTIQWREYSNHSDKDGASYSYWAVNANWNSFNEGWNVNANSVDNQNEWNAGNQVLSRNYLCSVAPPICGAVVFLCQPPSILPISDSFSDSAIYLFVWIISVSQAT